jgi:hypothetical protein
MKRVYIAGPISKGDLLHNVMQADEAMYRLMVAGLAPYNPILSVFAGGVYDYFPNWGKVVAMGSSGAAGNFLSNLAYDDWLNVCLPWVEVADAVLRLPGKSFGADQEVAHATAKGIPVFTIVDEVIKWAKK